MAHVPWEQKGKGENKESARDHDVSNSQNTSNPQAEVFDRYDEFKPFKSLDVASMPPKRTKVTIKGRRLSRKDPGAAGDSGTWILEPEQDNIGNTKEAWKLAASKMKALEPHTLQGTGSQSTTTPQPVNMAGYPKIPREARNKKSGIYASGSIENLGLQSPHMTWRDADVVNMEGYRESVRTRRPTAPKPRALKRGDSSITLQDTSQHSIHAHQIPPVSTGGGTRDGAATAVRDEISISPGVDVAWKESWVLTAPNRHSLEKTTLDDHTSVTDSMLMFESYREPETFDREPEIKDPKDEMSLKSPPKNQQPLQREKRPSLAEKTASKDQLVEQMSLNEKQDRQRRGSPSPMAGLRGSVDRPLGEDREIFPSKDMLSSSSRGFLPVLPTSTDRDQPSEVKKLPMTKYCPWHPRPIYNTWIPQKDTLPAWLNEESTTQYSSKLSKKMPSDKASNISEMPICCQPDESASVKEIVIPPKKPQRKEVVRWLTGYPLHTRFFRETHDLKKNPIPGVVVEVDEENPRRLLVKIDGPADSSYENGVFLFEVFFPGLYPHEAPKLRFMTKIFHPNIDKLGRVRLPMVEEKWAPSILLRQVFEGLQELLAKPNLSDPMAVDVARRWFWHEPSAKHTARVWTKRFAHAHPIQRWMDCNCKCFCEHKSPPCPT